MTSKETFTHYQPLGNSDPAHTATAPGGLSAKAPAMTLHTDALHATRDEPVAFVLPGTAFRVSAGVAAEMTERGLARMQ